MERRDQVLRLQAQLEAKRKELAHLQQRIHKAEVCRRSQASGEKECSQSRKQEASDESAASTGCDRSASQELVRSLTDPHLPLWLSGQHYPAQYLIRHTRSMSRAHRGLGVVTMPKPPPCSTIKDFDLPDDDMFCHLKEQRLREPPSTNQQPPSCCQEISCRLEEGHNVPIQLKCTHHIQCAPGEMTQSERIDGKVLVKGDGSFAVLFEDRLTFYCGTSTDHCYSHSLSKAVICFDWLSSEKGAVLMAIAHPGEIAVLVHSEGRFEQLSLPVPSEGIAWPEDFASHYLGMSEPSTGSVLVAACYSGEVCVWSVGVEPCQCELASTFSIPHLCSLFLLNDWLLATTKDYHLLVWESCSSGGRLSTPSREVSLSCCPSDNQRPPLPLILAATYTNNCLLIVLTLDWSGDPRLSGAAAAWVVALKDGHHFPYLLHTYLNPHTTIDLPLLLYAYTEPWRLVGAVGREQLLVWRATGGLPSVTITLEGESASDLAWDPLSNTCLILDKFQQLHFFQNTNT